MAVASLEMIDAFKAYIISSPDATELCKQAMCYLIDCSDNLTKSSRIKMVHHGREIALGVNDMNLSNCNTVLSNFLKRNGYNICFAGYSFARVSKTRQIIYGVTLTTNGRSSCYTNCQQFPYHPTQLRRIDLSHYTR